MSLPEGVRLYELLFRGQPDGTLTWHVILAAEASDPFGPPRQVLTDAMTPAMAAERFGLDLGELVEGLNAAALLERDALAAQLEAVAGGEAPGGS